MSAARPLYQRAQRARAKKLSTRNMTTKALLALGSLLARAGKPRELLVLRTWPKHRQGAAYLWALGRVEGWSDEPPPWWLR